MGWWVWNQNQHPTTIRSWVPANTHQAVFLRKFT